MRRPPKPIRTIMKALSEGRPWSTPKMHITYAGVQDRRVAFCTNKRRDPIQRSHRQGSFYEFEELSILRAVAPKGGVYVDLGANVGNHSLFFALFMQARQVIPVEPNPLAYELLIANTLANGLEDTIVFDRLGVGVSDGHGGGFAMEQRPVNLGGARMLEGEGEIEVFAADALLDDVAPDFIKIDVEGMEMKVLAGLEKTVARTQPMIFAEVDNKNTDAFADWATACGYEIACSLQRYHTNKNHLLVRADQAQAVRQTIETLEQD